MLKISRFPLDFLTHENVTFDYHSSCLVHVEIPKLPALMREYEILVSLSLTKYYWAFAQTNSDIKIVRDCNRFDLIVKPVGDPW